MNTGFNIDHTLFFYHLYGCYEWKSLSTLHVPEMEICNGMTLLTHTMLTPSMYGANLRTLH